MGIYTTVAPNKWRRGATCHGLVPFSLPYTERIAELKPWDLLFSEEDASLIGLVFIGRMHE